MIVIARLSHSAVLHEPLHETADRCHIADRRPRHKRIRRDQQLRLRRECLHIGQLHHVGVIIRMHDRRTQVRQPIGQLTGDESNLARAGHPSRVPIPRASAAGRQMGLLTDSVVMTDNLATVLDIEIDGTIGACPDMAAVDQALRDTLGL